jgi:outer membrane lipoprotein carrier protein
MKRFFLICTLIALAGSATYAQMPKETEDLKAKGILDGVSKKTESYSTIKAEFNIMTSGPDGKAKDNIAGTMLHKGNKYKLDIKGQTIFCDGKVQTTYIKEDNTAQINNAPDPTKSDNINPANIFTIYKKDFKYKFDKEEVQNGVTVQIINLYPLVPGKKPYHTVRLTIDKIKQQITSVKVMNKDGNTTTITVKSFIPNTDMPDATFVFNKLDYPGVSIEDLRD